MKRSPRDMVWILLLAAVAFTGISTLSRRIYAAQSIGEADPLALIIEPPLAVLCLHQPQTLQLMLPSLPAVQRLLLAYLPENPLCQPEQIGEWVPFTLVYYPEGEVWMATLTERTAKQLWKRLDASHSFAAEEQTELTLPCAITRSEANASWAAITTKGFSWPPTTANCCGRPSSCN